jgi:hypothetical protein
MQVKKELWDEFQHLKDGVIRLDRMIELEKPPTPPLFAEAKEALEKRIEDMYFYLDTPAKSDVVLRARAIKELLGSLYIPLKSEVCREVVNKAYPKKDIGYGRYFIKKEVRGGEYEAGFGNMFTYLGAYELNNKQAAEAFLKLMQTPFFEGDITI